MRWPHSCSLVRSCPCHQTEVSPRRRTACGERVAGAQLERFADVCACRRDGVCPNGSACPCCCAATRFGLKRLAPSHAHSRIPGHNDAVRGEEAWRALRRAARREQQRVDELERGQ